MRSFGGGGGQTWTNARVAGKTRRRAARTLREVATDIIMVALHSQAPWKRLLLMKPRPQIGGGKTRGRGARVMKYLVHVRETDII